jgi:A/G-specific adenine glycosylase
MANRRAGVDHEAPAGGAPGRIAARLLEFFDARRRDLPWRRSADPYRVWVSEVMLQQTRVATVLPCYERWLRRFPTLQALARASLDDVLVEWQGLGYYSRARNLHATARVVRERFAGRWPDTADGLRALPGIGEYTAGAVASIAFGRPEPAIDGNARRVLARLFDLEHPRARQLRSLALALIPADRPGDFNQALMELGAAVCTPRQPRCGRCPLRGDCLARAHGTERLRPARRARDPVPSCDVGVAVVVAPGDRMLLVRRPGHGLLGGLWAFPGAEPRRGESLRAAAARAARAAGAGVRARDGEAIGTVPHAFSHRIETYHVHRFDRSGANAASGPAMQESGARAARGRARAAPRGERDPAADTVWADPAALDGLALPAAQRRIARQVMP